MDETFRFDGVLWIPLYVRSQDQLCRLCNNPIRVVPGGRTRAFRPHVADRRKKLRVCAFCARRQSLKEEYYHAEHTADVS